MQVSSVARIFNDSLPQSQQQSPFISLSSGQNSISLQNNFPKEGNQEPNLSPTVEEAPERLEQGSVPSHDHIHYSDNLYSILGDEMNQKRRGTQNTFCDTNISLLEYIEGIRKILITKHLLRNSQRKAEREVQYSLQNYEETLDGEDLFQSERFLVNISDPYTLEFLFKGDEDSNEKETLPKNEGKFSQKLERSFNEKEFFITLTEKEETKILGNVKLVNGNYNVYDKNGVLIFQIEKISYPEEQNQITIIRQVEDEDKEEEMGSVELGPWNFLTLEGDIWFTGGCSPKEKLLIMGTVFVLLMKIPLSKGIFQNRYERNVCSVRGLWKEVLNKMRSIF